MCSVRVRVLASALLAALLTGGACASSGDDAAAPDVYHITQERHGQTVQVRLGQTVALLLPTKAGSPSHWVPLVGDTSILAQQGSRGLISPRRGNIVIGGAAGYERMLFQARQAGSTRLRATRVRPAREGGGTAVFEVTVQVVPATLE